MFFPVGLGTLLQNAVRKMARNRRFGRVLEVFRDMLPGTVAQNGGPKPSVLGAARRRVSACWSARLYISKDDCENRPGTVPGCPLPCELSGGRIFWLPGCRVVLSSWGIRQASREPRGKASREGFARARVRLHRYGWRISRGPRFGAFLHGRRKFSRARSMISTDRRKDIPKMRMTEAQRFFTCVFR